MNLHDLLTPDRIRLDVPASDWRSAVEEAGRLLVLTNIVTPAYVAAMLRTAETLGPYMVVAPGIALPHARPEDGALRTGLALIRLATPVNFGHSTNDPVDLIIPFAAVDADSHVLALSQLAQRLADRDVLHGLRRARSPIDAWSSLMREL